MKCNHHVSQVSNISAFVAYRRGLWRKRDLEEDVAISSLRSLATSLIDSADARQPREGTFRDLPDYQCILRAALRYCDCAPPLVCNAKQVISQLVCMEGDPWIRCQRGVEHSANSFPHLANSQGLKNGGEDRVNQVWSHRCAVWVAAWASLLERGV